MAGPDRTVIGWDVGGAHVKACLMQRGEVVDVAQWACTLWHGLERLAPVIETARSRWPRFDAAQHAVTMTGEMVDAFADREDGVRRIASELARSIRTASIAPDPVRFFAGDAGWLRSDAVGQNWEAIASANWLATARHAALRFGDGVLIDIGSTTTDLIGFSGGRVRSASRTDAQRLASGELVYQGVVRTPLCALARRIDWRGAPHNVMNEFFATTADVYRLTGELNPAHDLHPSADNAAKDLPATCQRLARMIGLDQRDGGPAEWLQFARSWRTAQLLELGGQLRRVIAAHGLARDAVVVAAGCGDFLVDELLAQAMPDNAVTAQPLPRRRPASYGRHVARIASRDDAGRESIQAWAQVCAPCVATAALFEMDSR